MKYLVGSVQASTALQAAWLQQAEVLFQLLSMATEVTVITGNQLICGADLHLQSAYKQGVALTRRNTTGPPSIIILEAA